MKINLKESEKVALANHIAEKNSARICKYAPHLKEKVRQSEFEFFKKCLDETEDY